MDHHLGFEQLACQVSGEILGALLGDGISQNGQGSFLYNSIRKHNRECIFPNAQDLFYDTGIRTDMMV